ncbi:hypothetical protein MTsPCn3_23280 [Erythrobacter sp. MTPC3]
MRSMSHHEAAECGEIPRNSLPTRRDWTRRASVLTIDLVDGTFACAFGLAETYGLLPR